MLTFYTDIQTQISNFCLCQVKGLPKTDKKNDVIVDPGVYELKKSTEYSQIAELHKIACEGKRKISIDYPCDMNLNFSDLFIEKSKANNMKYLWNSNYICAVQYHFMDINDFEFQFKWLEERIDVKHKIIGIGNLCRIMRPNRFTDLVFDFLLQKPYKFHFYGLSLALINKYLTQFKQDISVDSTKWTRAVSNDLKSAFGVCCRKNTRDLYFLEYIRSINCEVRW